MRLSDLDPRWAIDADIVIGGVLKHFEGRSGMAVNASSAATRVASSTLYKCPRW